MIAPMDSLKTILVAEDNPKDVRLVLAALKEHVPDSNVVVVHDGEEALDYLHCEGKYQARAWGNPGVVLLDITMPKVDGFNVLKTIKADEALMSIPVVMLTSSREIKDLVAAHKLGGVAYLVKPMELAQLVDSMRQLEVFGLSPASFSKNP